MTLSSTSFTPDAPAISRIGRFYLTRELGRGTLGCVYLGHDPVLGRDVAIKTFNPRLTAAERARHEQQFINEARAAGSLAHPHIVTIYDASSEGGTTYVAMEYLQGKELDKMLSDGRCFKPHEAASIAWKIADALNHAHQRDVIHRDLKPANIFMASGDQPKLIDFGIARAPNRVNERGRHDDDEPYTLLRENKVLGTPHYMSPEQALAKPVDKRTDIYSLGVVMYEMLTGRTPFRAESAEKLLHQVAFKTPPAPHEIDSQIPAVLSQIVMRAMSKRPEKRYDDAEKMALDIKRYLLTERHARKRMQIELPVAEQRNPATGPRASWLAYLSLAVAAAIAIATGMRLLQ